jgi:two-component system sensor histidine kinase MprB
LHERRLVFERFYRSTTARALPGSGLGLAIVKQVVLKHGGLLRVEDTVSGGQPPGTSIYVLLPGRAIPESAYPPVDEDRGDDVITDPAVPTRGNGANSRDSANVISVDSQSARAR